MNALDRVPRWVWWGLGGAATAGVLGFVGVTYADGKVSGLTFLKKIDGVPVAWWSASKFEAMRAAAAADGVVLRLNSGFRSYAEQVKLYLESFLPGAPIAAKPGYSNHQSGRAYDIVTGGSTSTPIYQWLAANAARFGFKRTVASEIWHWEYIG